jgi:hypothetical protein
MRAASEPIFVPADDEVAIVVAFFAGAKSIGHFDAQWVGSHLALTARMYIQFRKTCIFIQHQGGSACGLTAVGIAAACCSVCDAGQS